MYILNRPAYRVRNGADGFSLVELMVVVLIIGILVAVATPVFYANVANAQKKTCFTNQRTIESAVGAWAASNAAPVTVLEGVVDQDHPLIRDSMLRSAPRCMSAPAPADPLDPDASTGAYSLDASAAVEPCLFGTLGAHGSY